VPVVRKPYPDRVALLAAVAPLVAGLAVVLVLGLWIPGSLNTVIRHAIAVIS